ncbi:MAG: hypothetical protein JST64_01395 [Actinobacteria bacterium]|nr:hypothetical protein [Actinomycetota bacterium]
MRYQSGSTEIGAGATVACSTLVEVVEVLGADVRSEERPAIHTPASTRTAATLTPIAIRILGGTPFMP